MNDFALGLDLPATQGFPIAPADADLREVTRALHVNVGGIARVIFADAETDAPIDLNVETGAVYPFRVRRVLPGTTAALVGLV